MMGISRRAKFVEFRISYLSIIILRNGAILLCLERELVGYAVCVLNSQTDC